MKNQNPQDVLDRLLRASNSKSDAALAAHLGLSSQAIYNARNKGQVPTSWVFDIAQTFGVSTDWLFFGTGAIQRNDETAHVTDANQVQILVASGMEIAFIPMVEAALSPGHDSFETGDENERKYAFRSDILRRKGNLSEMVLMRVDGDSMEPQICNGDFVLIDQSQKTLRPGQIYAVSVEDMVYLKLVNAEPGKLILSSANASYPPLELDTRGGPENAVRIVGRCVWSCREL
jgi:phage repressor protein C with HTH and peptisase S24 domain